MPAPWASTSRRMGTSSPAALANQVQQASNVSWENNNDRESLASVLEKSNGNTIHIHMNCNGSGGGPANCGGFPGGAYPVGPLGYNPSFVPTLPGMWPLPPLSYGNGFYPPGFVFGCPSGPVLLPPVVNQCGGTVPAGW